MILCLDVGNTSLHWGLLKAGQVQRQGQIRGDQLSKEGSADWFDEIGDLSDVEGTAWCSVVPAINPTLEAAVSSVLPGKSCHGLTHDQKLGISISYPRPSEIGQDRLANAVGAAGRYALPAVVIDMGTATTFDIITRGGGYEGGIIAPGMSLMTRYLHEQTALLPQLEDRELVRGPAIGRSTRDAMRSGCVIGFTGMIRSLLEAVRGELIQLGESDEPTVILTGGNAGDLWARELPGCQWNPALTLQGLAEFYRLQA